MKFKIKRELLLEALNKVSKICFIDLFLFFILISLSLQRYIFYLRCARKKHINQYFYSVIRKIDGNKVLKKITFTLFFSLKLL